MRYLFPVLWIICCAVQLKAHPMPNSVLLLDIRETNVHAVLQWPVNELQLALPDKPIAAQPDSFLAHNSLWLDHYLHSHMRITDSTVRNWDVQIESKKIMTTEQEYTGPFHELVFELELQPPPGSSPRHFTMYYSAIMHQVVTHKMLIRISHDWDGGLSEKDSINADLGVLMTNTSDGNIPPVIINLDEGSKWKGFKNMVSLGISHISEGTDHLLFLLILMLPAPLIADAGKWTKTGETKYSLVRLLKIATAFTAGHSITLLAGAVGWLRLPSQPVEILIALSILISGIHALRPLFPGREMFVAAGFGLVHGLAFAATLANLDLDAGRMALSILGFNIGIELMQLFIILLVVPWLMLLSPYPLYKPVRIAGAVFAILAAAAWIAERTSMRTNRMSSWVQDIASHGAWVILIIAVTAISCHVLYRLKSGNS